MAILVKSSTKSDEKNRWGTTAECFLDATALYGRKFKLDVAAEPETAKVTQFICSPDFFKLKTWASSLIKNDKEIIAVNALTCDWTQDWWCNPPFDMKPEFLTAAHHQSVVNGFSGMMLLPYESQTIWWRQYVENIATAVFIPDGRYPFLEIDGVTVKKGINFGSVFVLFTPHYHTKTEYIPFNQYFSLPDEQRNKRRKRRINNVV